MQLSEEDHDAIYKAAGKIDFPPSHNEIADAAFSLGIERARVVAPLVFTPQAKCWREAEPTTGRRYTTFQRNDSEWVIRFNGEQVATEATEALADSKAQAHHEAYVLSMLEAV